VPQPPANDDVNGGEIAAAVTEWQGSRAHRLAALQRSTCFFKRCYRSSSKGSVAMACKGNSPLTALSNDAWRYIVWQPKGNGTREPLPQGVFRRRGCAEALEHGDMMEEMEDRQRETNMASIDPLMWLCKGCNPEKVDGGGNEQKQTAAVESEGKARDEPLPLSIQLFITKRYFVLKRK
jgi:hypothetical protein